MRKSMITTNNDDLTLDEYKAQTGRVRGKHTLPVDSTATAGLATLSVAPYG